VLKVLDGDGPGPYGSGSFFSIMKKSNQSYGSWCKSGPSGPPSSHPPLPPVNYKKLQKSEKADKWDWAARWPPALATPPPSLSPLSALTPSLGPGSSHVSPEFVASRTLTPGLPLVPLAPLNPLPSPVTLSQVKDVVTTSDMVQDLHSCHLPPPLLSSFNLPPSLEMAVDEAKDPLLAWSHA
jgi:hypothetical protein